MCQATTNNSLLKREAPDAALQTPSSALQTSFQLFYPQKSSHFREVFVYAYAVKHDRKDSQGPLVPSARSCEGGLSTSQIQLLDSRNQTNVWFERAHHSSVD